VVVVRDWLAPSACDEHRRVLEEALDTIETPCRAMTYAELEKERRALRIDRSRGYDAGMIDIFHVDRAVPVLATLPGREDLAAIVSQAAGRSFGAHHVNAYVNRGVDRPRPLHADSYRGQYKAFLYLTDVTRPADGPYRFVPGSHRPGLVHRTARRLVNRLRGHPITDALLAELHPAASLFAPRGTLIISDQSGIHGGHPQSADGLRILVVTTLLPTSSIRSNP
jgi:hypothetical protein